MGRSGERLRPVRTAASFVGRAAELGAVVSALREPNALVLIEGDAGMGKTRLVAECLQATELGSLRVMTADCLPLAEPFPLGPLVEMLHHQPLADLPLSPLAGALRPLLPEWAASLPATPEPLDDPQAVRHRVLRAMTEVVAALCVDALVVEDVHWADPATLEFLLMLTANPPADLRVVLTCRPTGEAPESPLLRVTVRSARRMTQTRVLLEPLSLAASRQLVGSMFDSGEVSASFVDFVHRRTDGVPLALQESLTLMLDRGDIVWQGGEWSRRAVEELAVPPTVRDSVIERVDRLDPQTRRLLWAAAVLGEPAEESLLGRVSGLDGAQTRRALGQALNSVLLREVRAGRFQFRHVLAAQAVEDAIPGSERRPLHHRAAAALLASTSPQVVRLSRHFREADDIAAWSVYGMAAAEVALESGEDRAAVVALLDLVSHPELADEARTDIARKLAEAATWGVAGLGDLGGGVVTALRGVLDTSHPSAESAEIRLLLGRLLLQLGEFDAAAEQIELALDPLAQRPELAARAMISLAWPRGREWPAHRHRDWLERAGALLPEVPDGSDRILLEVDQASVRLMLGQDAGWDFPAQLRKTATTLFEQRQVARLLMNTGHVGIAWGRDEQARRRLDEAAELMETTGLSPVAELGPTDDHLSRLARRPLGRAARARPRPRQRRGHLAGGAPGSAGHPGAARDGHR